MAQLISFPSIAASPLGMRANLDTAARPMLWPGPPAQLQIRTVINYRFHPPPHFRSNTLIQSGALHSVFRALGRVKIRSTYLALGTNSQCNASYCITWTTASASFSANLDQVGSNYCIGPGSQPAIAVVSSIALPNGKAFTFAYDGQYGTLNRLTYPSGGYVSYVWGLNQDAEFGQWPAGTDQYSTATCQYLYDNPAIIKRIVNDGSSDVLEQDFSYTTTWQSGIWTTKQTTVTTHDLVRNISYNTVYTYTWRSADNPPNTSDWPRQLPVESVIQYYGTDGALLRTVNKSWINERILSSEQTTLDTSGSVSETDWTYDPSYWYSDQNISLQSEEVIEKDEYDYGSGSHGSPSSQDFYELRLG